MNSFKSACSVAKSSPVLLNQLEENVEPCLGRQVSVKLVVSRFGIFKTAEHLNDPLHEADFNSQHPARKQKTVSPSPRPWPAEFVLIAHDVVPSSKRRSVRR